MSVCSVGSDLWFTELQHVWTNQRMAQKTKKNKKKQNMLTQDEWCVYEIQTQQACCVRILYQSHPVAFFFNWIFYFCLSGKIGLSSFRVAQWFKVEFRPTSVLRHAPTAATSKLAGSSGKKSWTWLSTPQYSLIEEHSVDQTSKCPSLVDYIVSLCHLFLIRNLISLNTIQ